MKRLLPAAAALLLVATILAAQESSTEVFAPFVSRLKAAATEDGVLLTWRKSRDVEGAYLVYRAGTEITEQSFAKAEFIARVAPEAEAYTDSPPYGRDVFYAVLIEGTDGKRYSIFIPFRNKTTSPVKIQRPVAEIETAADLKGLKAALKGDAVVVTFSSSRADRSLLLFRSTRPIRAMEDLVGSSLNIPLLQGTTLYEDRPIPGVEYYYCVMDERLLASGKSPILQGENSTRVAVSVPLEFGQAVSQARSRPLPRLMIPAGVEFGDELIPSPPFLLPRQQELSPTTAKAVARLRSGIRPAPAPSPSPVILEEERSGRARGEDSILAELVQSSFASKNYTEAESKLLRFLRIEREGRAEARAHFYLGQIYFFRGDARSAFLSFLLANDAYYEATQTWLDLCFTALS